MNLYQGIYIRIAWDAFPHAFPHLTSSPHLILSCFFQFAEGDIESQKDRVTCVRWWVVVVFLSSPVICICPASFIGSSQSWFVNIVALFFSTFMWKKWGPVKLMGELTHWKRPWCWEELGAGGEGNDRGWHGWMTSPVWWTWVWVNFGSWWWTERSGVLWLMGLQRVGHDWMTELNWTEA